MRRALHVLANGKLADLVAYRRQAGVDPGHPRLEVGHGVIGPGPLLRRLGQLVGGAVGPLLRGLELVGGGGGIGPVRAATITATTATPAHVAPRPRRDTMTRTTVGPAGATPQVSTRAAGEVVQAAVDQRSAIEVLARHSMSTTQTFAAAR